MTSSIVLRAKPENFFIRCSSPARSDANITMAERPAASLWHGTTRRVEKELRDLPANPDVSSAGPILSIGEDIMHWQATLAGPPGSPYQGGTFHLDIKIPDQHPWKAFVTRIFHPNVVQSLRRGFDGVGAIFIHTSFGAWSPVHARARREVRRADRVAR